LAIILVAIGLTVGAIKTIQKITTIVAPSRSITTTSQDTTELREKITELNKAPGASTQLTITEKELTQLLIETVSKNPNLPLRNIQTVINPEGITLTGTATKFLNSTLTIDILPKVVDGQIKMELVKIQAGSFPVPSQLTEVIAQGVDSLLSEQLNQVKGVAVKSLQLGNGKLQITGTLTDQPAPHSS
jgi:hypothetical protein